MAIVIAALNVSNNLSNEPRPTGADEAGRRTDDRPLWAAPHRSLTTVAGIPPLISSSRYVANEGRAVLSAQRTVDKQATCLSR